MVLICGNLTLHQTNLFSESDHPNMVMLENRILSTVVSVNNMTIVWKSESQYYIRVEDASVFTMLMIVFPPKVGIIVGEYV